MKKKTENKGQNPLSEEQIFEQELFYALKSYGYLFPENKKDVEQFDALYGNTEIETPAHINIPQQNKSSKLEILKNYNFDLSLSTAAFKADSDNNIDLPDNFADNSNKTKPRPKK